MEKRKSMLKNTMRGLALFAMVAIVVFIMVAPALAFQDASAPAAPAKVPLTAKIILIAGLVSGGIQGLKSLLAKVGVNLPGKVAIVLNIVATAVTAIAAADPGQLLSVSFIANLLLGIVSSAGFHDLGNFFTSKHGT
jgi:chemotaxis response regulator CheB